MEGGRVDIRTITVKLTVGDDKVFDSFSTLGDGQETCVLMLSTVTKTLIDGVDILYGIKSRKGG